MHWWSRSDRIQWELDELTRVGFRFDPPSSVDDVLTLFVYVSISDTEHRLEVDFPQLYPYFRFEVRAPSLALPHHQHLLGKNLCLMPRGTEHWEIGKSLAWYLTEQLPKVISAGNAASAGDVTVAEEPQAEPVTDYCLYRDDAMILIDGDWHLPEDFTTGQITVLCDAQNEPTDPVRGTVMRITTMRGEVLFTAPSHLQRGGHAVHGHIVKLSSPVIESNPADFRHRLKGEFFRNEPDKRPHILAVVMPEEHAWRDSCGQGWLFITTDKKNRSSYVRAGRAGKQDLRVRAPELRDLANKTVALFGLGCNGGISAIEFAKAGTGEVRVLDHDYLDPGTLLRWYLGLPLSGIRKASVITSFIKSHYPLTQVVPYQHHVGRFQDDHQVLAAMTSNASLIYDATAEPGVSYFLAELARYRNIPFVHVSGTQGGWGGVIVRLNERTGCWYCLQLAEQQGRIPQAAADRTAMVQPAGCADPTFTGAGFDLATVALSGVRTAIATLSEHYPEQPWDVTIISLRDELGRLIPPRFDTMLLPKDPACKACGSA